jgi:toxin ParE1/3/4
MSHFDLTARAAADLREIGHYTKKTWGVAQARHYRDEIELALRKLSLTPDIGRQRDAIAPGVRSFKVAAHIAFYVQRKDGITILRLLHPSMDVDAAFD